MQNFFLREAEKRDDPFLLSHAAVQMSLFAARLILAYNRILFPSNKRLMERLATAPDQPDGFAENLIKHVRSPGVDFGKELTASLNDFHGWNIDWDTALGQYSDDSELNWYDHPAPVAES